MLSTLQVGLLEKTREELHANPELSGKEYKTQAYLLSFLEKHTTAKLTKVGKTGLIASFSSSVKGQAVLLRADIDALPIQETNAFSYKSKTECVSHKCGHDGHAAMLLGVALLLSENPTSKGTVHLLFQPSEENGKGAEAVLNDPNFKALHIDTVFALHNLPGYPLKQIVVKENEFTANVKSVIIKLTGRTAHAAEPEKGINPSLAISTILQFSEEQTNNEPTSKDFFLFTPVHITMGELAYGVSAGYGEVHLTLRSWSTELMQKKCEKLETYINTLCAQQKLISDIQYTEVFYANVNHPQANETIKNAAKTSNLNLVTNATPFKWGEDFGLFTQRYKGAMFGLGSGENTPALHNPDYDFPNEIIPSGVAVFYHIIHQNI